MVHYNDPHLELENRYGYHPGTEWSIPRHEAIRARFLELANWIEDRVPNGRAKSIVQTKLQEASMWANFAVAEQVPLEVGTAQERLEMGTAQERLNLVVEAELARRVAEHELVIKKNQQSHK